MMYSQDPIDAAIDALNEYSIAIPICEGYQFNLSDMREAMQAAIAAYLDAMPSPLYHCESVWEAEQRSTAELATLRARAERAEQDARFAVEALLLHNKDALPMATRMVEMEQALSAAQSTIAELTGQVERQIGALRTAVLALAHANTEMAPGLYDKAYNAVSDELARAALGGEKSTAPAFTLPPETPPPE